VIGFDIEWRPNFIKGRPENRVACVQLADQSGVAIIQVSGMTSLPEILVQILQDAGIMKVGVGISGALLNAKQMLH
jgi:exonuclease 3'-5' domain-containing protein 2